MADPGLAEKVARRVSDDLATRLSHETDEHWKVEAVQELLPLGPDGNISLTDHAPEVLDRHGWNYVFYLTNLPAFRDRQPMLCQTVAQSRGARIVLPASDAGIWCKSSPLPCR